MLVKTEMEHREVACSVSTGYRAATPVVYITEINFGKTAAMLAVLARKPPAQRPFIAIVATSQVSLIIYRKI